MARKLKQRLVDMAADPDETGRGGKLEDLLRDIKAVEAARFRNEENWQRRKEKEKKWKDRTAVTHSGGRETSTS